MSTVAQSDSVSAWPAGTRDRPELAVVIVNWNVRELLRRCLAALERGLPEGVAAATLVVDNASTDGSAAMVGAEFAWVNVLPSPENLGFTGGNNLALLALGFRPRGEEAGRSGAVLARQPGLAPAAQLAQPRYVLLLNPDTEIDEAALAAMVAYMDAHPDVGLLGPRLRYPDGTAQPTRRRFPTPATAFIESTVLQRWWPEHRVLQQYYVADRPSDEIQDVDWLVGACLLARSEAVAAAGLLDEGYFMYSEEVDWARRFKALGWRVVYLPTAEVMHHEGRSSEQVVAERHIRFQTSKVRYFRVWHGRWVAEVIRVFLLLTYVYQAAEEGAKWLVGHKRALRAERLAAYRRVLRSGLRP